MALRHYEKLAGIVALSTYLVLDDTLAAERSETNATTPILQAHGTHDPMVVLERGQEARDHLIAAGYDVTWLTYPMQHEVCLEEIQVIGAFLRDRFGG